MFERFTDNARKAMALANIEAQRLNHEYIGLNHVVLGLIKNDGCSAHAMLSACGVSIPALRLRVESIDRKHTEDKASPTRLPQMPGAKAAIEEAIRESLHQGHNYVGTEHMIVGATRVRSSPWGEIWAEFNIDADRLWKAEKGLPREQNIADLISPRESRAPEPVGAYPTTRRVGNLLFLSGQGPRQRGSKDIPGVVLGADGRMVSYDVAAQVRAVFQNVKWVLEEHGSSFDRIVDVTCFLTNLEKDFPAYNKAYAELFPPGVSQPCRTTIGITALPQGGNAPIAFEAKVVATVG